MRVLIVTPKVTGIGGVARHVSALASRLRRRNIEVDVISTEDTSRVAVKATF